MSGADQLSSLREREILDALKRAGGSGRVQFLADQLRVSSETIRRNVKSLEALGLVTKVHGGVHLAGQEAEPPLQFRMNRATEAKRRIARAVAGLVQDGDALFLDIGSTTAYIANALADHANLFIVTNSLSVAQSLATRNNNRVFFAGGYQRSHDGGSFGLEAGAFVQRFRVRYAFLSVAAINAASGFMLQDLEEAEFSRLAGAQADTRFIVADSSKFGKSAPIIMGPPSAYQGLFTESAPPADIAAMLAENAVAVTLC